MRIVLTCSCTIFFYPPFFHFGYLLVEGTGVPLALKIMGKEVVYYQAEDIDLTPEIVLLDLNPCEAVHAIL